MSREKVEKMELVQYNNDFFYTYQRNGNDRNGNPIYKVNIFKKYYPCSTGTMDNAKNHVLSNYNCTIASMQKRRLTKENELRLQSYNIKSDIENIIKRL